MESRQESNRFYAIRSWSAHLATMLRDPRFRERSFDFRTLKVDGSFKHKLYGCLSKTNTEPHVSTNGDNQSMSNFSSGGETSFSIVSSPKHKVRDYDFLSPSPASFRIALRECLLTEKGRELLRGLIIALKESFATWQVVRPLSRDFP